MEAVTFESLEQMVATVDAVVIGEVVTAEPGPVFGDPEAPVEKIENTVRIDEVLYGMVERKADGSMWLQQSSWGPPGSTFNGLPNLQPSDRAIMFVERLCEPGGPPVYYIMNSQSAYLIDGSGDQIRDTGRDDDLSRQNERKTVSQMRREIAAARERVRNGQVEPARVIPKAPPGYHDEPSPYADQPEPRPLPPCDGSHS